MGLLTEFRAIRRDIIDLAVAAPSSPQPSPAELFLLAGAFLFATVWLLL